MAVAHTRAGLQEPRYSRRRRIGNNISQIRLLSFRGNASSTISVNSTYSIMKSRKPEGGGTRHAYPGERGLRHNAFSSGACSPGPCGSRHVCVSSTGASR